jgi:hypothetical protein
MSAHDPIQVAGAHTEAPGSYWNHAQAATAKAFLPINAPLTAAMSPASARQWVEH